MFSRWFPGIVSSSLFVALAVAALVTVAFATTLFDTVYQFPTGNGPQFIAIGNFDGDGSPDLATANWDANTFSILPGDGTGGFLTHLDFPAGAGPISLAVGRLDRDTNDDVAVANQLDGTVSVFLGDGNRSFVPLAPFSVGSFPYGVAIGLLNADTDPDLVVANQNSDTISILFGNGDGTFGGRIDLPTDMNPRHLVLAELNNNPGLDIAVTNISHHTISLFFGHGDGTFDPESRIPAGYCCEGIAAGYLNGDMNMDLVTSNRCDGTVSVLIGGGNGSFAAPVFYPVESGPQSIVMEDLDGNGSRDVAAANTGHHTLSVLLGDGNGVLGIEEQFTSGSSPTWIAAGDFNHDLKLDLAISNQVPNAVTILINTSPDIVGACCDPATGTCTLTAQVACSAPSAWQGAGTLCDPNPCPMCPVVVWGDNTNGQCIVPPPNADFMAVSGGGGHSLGLNSDGTIIAWGSNNLGQCNVPPLITDFVAASAGGYHSLGLRSDGTALAWGWNPDGQCNVPPLIHDFVAVAGGDAHSLGLRSDGSTLAWGWNQYGQCNPPPSNIGFVAISAGGFHNLGLKADGTIVPWGDNQYNQCTPVPSPNTGFVAVAGGYAHSLALRSDGSIAAWGWNQYGQCTLPSPNSGFVAIAAGQMFSLGLKSDGSIVVMGTNLHGEQNVPLPNIGYTAIAAGAYHGLAQRCSPPHTISATAGPNGSISPSGTVTVNHGGTQTFAMTPDQCYRVVNVLVDNMAVGAVSSYTFTNVVANHNIVAMFGLATASVPERLEAWWTFDDLVNSKMQDLAHCTSGVNAGTLQGGAALVPGIVGNALMCLTPVEGMRVQPTQNSIWIGGMGFAVDAWIYLLPGSPPSHRRMIANTGGFQFFVRDSRLVVQTGGASFTAGGAQMSENAWHHVAVTLYQSAHLGSFYVDGTVAGNFSPSGSDYATDLYVGRLNPMFGAGEPFNGYIDEVDLFRASLNGPATDGPVIQKIWAAGCAGKSREFVRLPLWCDGNHGIKSCAVFTNLTAIPQTYDWSLRPMHGPYCNGNFVFTPPGGAETVPAGGTVIRPVKITGAGCFGMDVTNRMSGNTFFTEGFTAQVGGQLWAAQEQCVAPPLAPPPGDRPGSSGSLAVEGLTPSASFTLHNDADQPQSVPCRFEGVNGESGERSEAIRLNDLDWGAPVDRIVELAAHDSVELGVTVTVDTNNPFQVDQILLSVDPDRDGTYEPLASSLIEAAEDSTGTVEGAQDLPPPVSTRLTVSPNPFGERVTVNLSLAEARELDLAVFDVTGRRVQLLHSGRLEAGPHPFVWNGREGGGSALKSGIYFVRAKAPGLELIAKALRLR